MSASAYLDKWRSFFFYYQLPTIQVSISEILNHIKEIAIAAFQKISNLFNSYDTFSNDSNIKTYGLVSCVSLIVFLFLSTLTKRGSSILVPLTPARPKKKS